MYGSKSKKEEPAANRKLRLPTESQMPVLKTIKAQFEEVSTKRGSIVELPWTTTVPSQQFILMGQWDKGAEFPVWTLYEETEGSSKMHWSQTFPPSDLQLLYDVVAMTAVHDAPSKIPDSLKARSLSDTASAESCASSDLRSKQAPASIRYTHPSQQSESFTPSMVPFSTSEQAPPPGPSPMPPSMGHPFPLPPSPGYPQTMPPPYGYPPQAPQGYPTPGMPTPGTAVPGMPIPGMPVPGTPVPGMPGGYQPNLGPTPFPPVQSGVPYPPTYTYGTPPVSGAAPPPPVSPTMGGQTSGRLSTTPYHDVAVSIPVDYGLIQKRQNILLGALLVEAGLITEPSLEAALKLQELVRNEKMPPHKAGQALRRLHTKGLSIDQYLSPSDFQENVSDESPEPAQSEPRNGAATAEDTKEPENAKASIDLLVTAGLITADDIKNACAAKSKNGGNIIRILESAGKIPKSTLDAAVICQSLIQDKLMKPEQCIIALNYCCRSRVGFDEALEELGWANPRKNKTA